MDDKYNDSIDILNIQKQIKQIILEPHYQNAFQIIEKFNNDPIFKKEIENVKKVIKEWSDYLIQNSKESIIKTFNSIRNNFPMYLNSEDIYKPVFNDFYKSIDFKKNTLLIDENDPSVMNVVNKSTGDSFPICNLKDTEGLPLLFNDIDKKEAEKFIDFLTKFPYLGLLNKTGKKILKELENKISKHSIKISNIDFYRSRLWEEKQELRFTPEQMWQPPYGVPGMERFNPVGINYLYFADSKETAENEVNREKGKKYTIMSVELNKEIQVLDISENSCYIFELCNKKRSSNNLNPTEYYLPNFIAQCCCYLEKQKKSSVKGIKYKSSLSKNGCCYVFFNLFRDSFDNEEIINID